MGRTPSAQINHLNSPCFRTFAAGSHFRWIAATTLTFRTCRREMSNTTHWYTNASDWKLRFLFVFIVQQKYRFQIIVKFVIDRRNSDIIRLENDVVKNWPANNGAGKSGAWCKYTFLVMPGTVPIIWLSIILCVRFFINCFLVTNTFIRFRRQMAFHHKFTQSYWPLICTKTICKFDYFSIGFLLVLFTFRGNWISDCIESFVSFVYV